MTSLGVHLVAVGASAAVHAAMWLAPMGHPGPAKGANDDALAIEVLTDPVTLSATVEPEPTVTPPAGHAAMSHTHAYPVPASHDWTPHDPNLVHALVLPAPATRAPPAEAAPADTTTDETAHFTMTIGAAGADAHGAVSPTGTAASHDDDTAVLPAQSVDAQARLMRGPAPAYPPAARADGIEGDVHLEFVVGASGGVESARVVHGVGRGLDESALVAVRQFRFAPAMKDGHAVRVRMGWSVQFRLQ